MGTLTLSVVLAIAVIALAALNLISLVIVQWKLHRAHQTNVALLVSIEEYVRQVRGHINPPTIYDSAIAAGRSDGDEPPVEARD